MFQHLTLYTLYFTRMTIDYIFTLCRHCIYFTAFLNCPAPARIKAPFFSVFQMSGRYTQELGAYAQEEAARLRDGVARDGAGLRRNTSVRSRAADLLEYEKDPCAKCHCEWRSPNKPLNL